MVDEDTAFELERQKRLDASPLFISLGLGNFEPVAKPAILTPEKATVRDLGPNRKAEILRLLTIRPRTIQFLTSCIAVEFGYNSSTTSGGSNELQ